MHTFGKAQDILVSINSMVKILRFEPGTPKNMSTYNSDILLSKRYNFFFLLSLFIETVICTGCTVFNCRMSVKALDPLRTYSQAQELGQVTVVDT